MVSPTKSSAFFNKPGYDFAEVRQPTSPGNLEHLETQTDQLKPCVLCECEQKREEVEIPSRPTRVVILPPETQSSQLIENAMPESPRSGSPRYKGNNPRASNTSATARKRWLSEPRYVAKVPYIDQGNLKHNCWETGSES